VTGTAARVQSSSRPTATANVSTRRLSLSRAIPLCPVAAWQFPGQTSSMLV